MSLLLVLDGATFAFFTTPLLLHYGQLHPAWQVAAIGSVASAIGSVIQLLALRWALLANHPWMRRIAPSQEKLARAVAAYPAASFAALVVARATPLPDAPLKLVAAAGGYPPALYALAILIGALPYYFVLALVGHAVRIPTWILVAAAVAIVLGALVDRWRRRRKTGS
jgi:ribonucleoside-triphosphate reductase